MDPGRAPRFCLAALLLLPLLPLPGLPPLPPLPLPLPVGAAHDHIVDFQYDPDVLNVVAGTEVTWDNHDQAPHTVTSFDGAFASPLLHKGDAWTFRFDEPGTYAYFCEPHASMTGEVVVSGFPFLGGAAPGSDQPS